jgi:hypothetical protein
VLLRGRPIRSERYQPRRSEQISSLPEFVLWAWERPEDLRFINPENTSVAFLAGTVQLRGDTVVVRPRLLSLLVPDHAQLVAVVRIEANQDAAQSQRRPKSQLSCAKRVSSSRRMHGIADENESYAGDLPQALLNGG